MFIYTNFIHGGIIPLILALEMNGFLPYQANSNPYLRNEHKDKEYRGDYIVYSGTPDEFTMNIKDVKTYLDMGSSMVKEKNVKVFLGTESASEGLSLFGYREVHILEPHYNLSRLEQAIGRAIRTYSHAHLPPSKRNVTIYKYIATDPKVETVDLYKYRSSELKAISTGIVEKILKENSIDCYLNKEGNIYNKTHFPEDVNLETSNNNKIKYNLSDKPFSRICHYLDNCSYKCLGERSAQHNKDFFNITHLEKNIEQLELETVKILQNFNIIKIEDIYYYLNLNKNNITYNALNLAINSILDKNYTYMNRDNIPGRIKKVGEFLKFIPLTLNYKNVNYPLLHNKKFYNKDIELTNYILQLSNVKKMKVNKYELDYNNIYIKLELEFTNIKTNNNMRSYKFNISLADDLILKFLFTKLNFYEKYEFFKTIIIKIRKGIGLTKIEQIYIDFFQFNLVRAKDIFNVNQNIIIGFIIGKDKGLVYYSINDKFECEINKSEYKKVIEHKKGIIKKYNINKLHSLYTIKNNNNKPDFKIKDLVKDDKKSITGSACINKGKNEILDYIKQINSSYKIDIKHKDVLCDDLAAIFLKVSSKSNIFSLTIEENLINTL